MTYPVVTKTHIKGLLKHIEVEFGVEERRSIMGVWQALGYEKFSEMDNKEKWRFYKYFSEIFYDAKTNNT